MCDTFILEIGDKVMIAVLPPIIWHYGIDFGTKLGKNQFSEYLENGIISQFGF